MDNKNNPSFYGDDLTISSLQSKKIKLFFQENKERRQSPRHNLHLQIKIFNENGSYTTQSINISLNGILLEQAIPTHFISGVCDILVTHPKTKETAVFTGKLVGNFLDPRRIIFAKQTPQSLKTLKKWITKYQKESVCLNHTNT